MAPTHTHPSSPSLWLVVPVSSKKCCLSCPTGEASAKFGVTPKWVSHCRRSVALCTMEQQTHTLSHLLRLCQHKAPALVVSRLAWDETGQRFAAQFPASVKNYGLELEQCIGTWQVMVARLRFVCVWGEADGGGCHELEMTLPPIVVSGTDAPSLWSGLFHHDTTRHILFARELLYSSARRAIDINETDAASSNLRLCAHLRARRESQPTVSVEHMLCRLHQNHLLEAVVVSISSMVF